MHERLWRSHRDWRWTISANGEVLDRGVARRKADALEQIGRSWCRHRREDDAAGDAGVLLYKPESAS